MDYLPCEPRRRTRRCKFTKGCMTMTMTQNELCLRYAQWRAAIGAQPDPETGSTLENAPPLDARNTRTTRAASFDKLTRAVAVHTDRTHIFAFEETTVWRREPDGDLTRQLGCCFEILVAT